MNKKIVSELAIGTILLIAIVVGGIFWFNAKKVEAPAAQQITDQLVVSVSQPAQQSANKMQVPKPVEETSNWQTYTNEKYGFELKLPASWKNYKAITEQAPDPMGIDEAQIHFLLNDGELFFTVTISNTSAREKYCAKVDAAKDLICLMTSGENIFGRTNKYIYGIFISQDELSSNERSFVDGDFKIVKESFKTL